MIFNSKTNYGSISKFFHWTIGLFILAELTIGFFLEDIGNKNIYYIHKTFGFFILILALTRLVWALFNKAPKHTELPNILQNISKFIHYLLYILTIFVPLIAFIASNAALKPVSFLFLFDIKPMFTEPNLELAKVLMKLHSLFAIMLAIIVAMHIAAGLYHLFIRKDQITEKMLPDFINKRLIKH